ncbi:helix-turn-helix transcriptional regulator [Granulicella sp. dw_53]|uniref:helix-turn-helix domain-containing protein n=1 Tax=Granulicella sp. dw_53 TaxID=2719792 RepID=UPI001BD6B797|nr:helix-turn-helix transcriptional regulator [Granulicella sp. dw_53]
MSGIGRKLRTIRRQRNLSLRQVEKLTGTIADRYGDTSRRISASWLGRIERERHSITHKRLQSLLAVYGVSHEELTDEVIPNDMGTQALHFQFPAMPAAILKDLTDFGDPLLPPENWLAYFPVTTLLPSLSQHGREDQPSGARRSRGPKSLFGILGANDTTLVPFVQPRAVVEIDPSLRTIKRGKTFHSIFDRPIYFLRSHDGYHCGWCELDMKQEWLTLVPSAVTGVSHQRWRYRQEVEIVGMVSRVLTRFGFPKSLIFDRLSPVGQSNST